MQRKMQTWVAGKRLKGFYSQELRQDQPFALELLRTFPGAWVYLAKELKDSRVPRQNCPCAPDGFSSLGVCLLMSCPVSSSRPNALDLLQSWGLEQSCSETAL